jgi:hypothetical protein
MSLALNSKVSIAKSLIPESKRLGTLPSRFPGLFLVYESLVYRYLSSFCSEYHGGYWEFADLSNGGFYMSLKSDSLYYLSVPSNGFEGEMSADAASLVANIFTLSQLANEHQLDYLIDMYFALRDYASHHPESRMILCAID